MKFIAFTKCTILITACTHCRSELLFLNALSTILKHPEEYRSDKSNISPFNPFDQTNTKFHREPFILIDFINRLH